MKNLLLLLALMCIITTSCEESGIEGPNNPIEQPGDENGNIDTPIECGDNEILYTTKYGYPIELNITDGFGGNLMSNTYENGYGRIIFDDDVIYIPKRAFLDCTAITTIILPNSLSAIGESAFYDCTSLTSITIPDGVTSIWDNAFNGCVSLTSITIPDSVTTIGESAFSNCDSLTSFYGGLASEDNRCLIIDGELLVFTDVGLTEYSIPDGVTTIGEWVFAGCDSLTSITIPDSVITIGEYAFSGCDSLTSITIPDSVTSIGNGAFQDCISLASVTIPNSVTTIGYNAFYRCTSLKAVYCKATTPPTGRSGMFYGNASGRLIYVPAESVDIYKTTSYWDDYKDYIIASSDF